MKYKVVKGLKYVGRVLDELKEHSTSSYFGETIQNVCQGNSGIAYEPKRREMTVMGDKRNKLLRKFYELMKENHVTLETI